ncbi:tRNA1(Val) (adenine(37)-N6)-methyltransferase [Maribacter sp. 2307ULW6-5]|uniref:tRNA1(Val) (adenine(37)-N6)-methyltransferase n=1 Tax=Maribacter sp. 2307ULW6-5 TaxID=3386275 RepID=UPI0039BC79C2
MGNKPFAFKQFTVHQDRCAMKVGTDGVLLGAWTTVPQGAGRILDIGAGTGLIALMLAQRCPAEDIEAIEIEEAAYEQCVANFEASPWSDRLFCYHAGLDELLEDEAAGPYDLIVCNPPFYSEAVSSGNRARDRARQNSALPFGELLEAVAQLLAPKGTFSVVLPIKEKNAFLGMAKEFGLFPSHITDVRGNPTVPSKRSLLQFTFQERGVATKPLVVEEARHRYTEAYRKLTHDFYLKM